MPYEPRLCLNRKMLYVETRTLFFALLSSLLHRKRFRRNNCGITIVSMHRKSKLFCVCLQLPIKQSNINYILCYSKIVKQSILTVSVPPKHEKCIVMLGCKLQCKREKRYIYWYPVFCAFIDVHPKLHVCLIFFAKIKFKISSEL